MRREIEKLIALALEEDLGKAGDVTSGSIFLKESARAVLFAKSTGVLAGKAVFEAVFKRIDPKTLIRFNYRDGDDLHPGCEVASVQGRARAVLGGERTALNLLAFLSGIATTTRRYVKEAGRYGTTIILDTRKTLPGYRALSKYAVRTGGGQNHRMGLYDMVLIKDNHIDACGSLTRAVERVRKKWKKRYKIEVECRTMVDVREALALEVDFIMLDNMDLNLLRDSITLVAGRIPVEISGGVDFDRLADLAGLGASYISVGALTHSVKAFDFSLKISI